MGRITPPHNGTYPSEATVPYYAAPVTNTNWSTVSPGSATMNWGRILSSGAQNDELSYYVTLERGVYTMSFPNSKDTNRGIYSVRIDGVEVGTIDGYNAASSNQNSTITGITIAGGGRKLITLKMATKNASSSSYFGSFHGMTFMRTGDVP